MKRALIFIIYLIFILLFPSYAYADDLDEASQQLLSGITTHNKSITVSIAVTDSNTNELAKKIYNTALNMTPLADYYKYSLCEGYSMKYKGYKRDGVYYYTFNYTIKYLISKKQEQQFEKELTKTIKSLKLNHKSTKSKVRIIYHYITDHVKYSHSSKDINFTAYGALHRHKAVCQGCAALFCRMCQKAHINSKIITGRSFNQNHAWDIVEINHKYYNIDPTWDLGHTCKHYKYFLKDNQHFKHHKRAPEFMTSTFNYTYPMID